MNDNNGFPLVLALLEEQLESRGINVSHKFIRTTFRNIDI